MDVKNYNFIIRGSNIMKSIKVPSTMNNAVIYARFSSSNQREESIDLNYEYAKPMQMQKDLML